MTTTNPMTTTTQLRHDAFVYDSDGHFVGQAGAFIEAGVAEGAALVVITNGANWDLLRESLGDAAGQVSFTDCAEYYTRPAKVISGYIETLRRLVGEGAPSVRVIGEFPNFASQVAWDEWSAYESIVNRAFADYPAWIVCAYDGRVIPDPVLDTVWRTHPNVLTDTWQSNPHYDEPERTLPLLASEDEPLTGLRSLPLVNHPAIFRRRLAQEMEAEGLNPEQISDMSQAANEVVVNALQHGGGLRAVRVGRAFDRFVCEVTDQTGRLDDPLAGYLAPGAQPEQSSGLWIARQLTWRLDLLPSSRGLTVRLWI